MKNQISNFLLERINAGDFPSAVYLAAEKGGIILQDALGLAVVEPERIEARIDTIYDLASLTKPLVTGLLSAKLIESGEINLSDNISKYFNQINFKAEDKSEITIENLLTHTSGLPAWKPLYLISDSGLRISDVIASQQLENPVGSKVIYSDLNFLLLGNLVERLYGKKLDEIARAEIFSPLKLQNTFFNPPKDLRKRIAASEKGNRYEKQTSIDLGYQIRNPKPEIRNQLVWGEVHDGNCYFLNGVAGHAGLFSTAEETFRIARQFLADQTELLKPETCRLFRTNFTEGLNEARSIAFQLAATKDSTASDALAGDSFGHLGFTGTSVWTEPESERVFILLTNRTHAHRLPFVNINSVRRRFHTLATEMLNAGSTGKPN
ncbi:MAG: serine hydrolase domain-containing protein [Pyrinomonadaceae bacterium]